MKRTKSASADAGRDVMPDSADDASWPFVSWTTTSLLPQMPEFSSTLFGTRIVGTPPLEYWTSRVPLLPTMNWVHVRMLQYIVVSEGGLRRTRVDLLDRGEVSCVGGIDGNTNVRRLKSMNG